MASFQAKVSWKSPRNGENKNFRSVSFIPLSRNRKFQKKQQKNCKNQKISLRIHFKPKQVGKGSEGKKIKVIVPFRSEPTRNRKFQ